MHASRQAGRQTGMQPNITQTNRQAAKRTSNKQTDRQTDTPTHRHTDGQTDTRTYNKQADIQTNGHNTDRHADRQADMTQTCTQTDKRTYYGQVDRHTDIKQTGGQSDRSTCGQNNKQADRQRYPVSRDVMLQVLAQTGFESGECFQQSISSGDMLLEMTNYEKRLDEIFVQDDNARIAEQLFEVLDELSDENAAAGFLCLITWSLP